MKDYMIDELPEETFRTLKDARAIAKKISKNGGHCSIYKYTDASGFMEWDGQTIYVYENGKEQKYDAMGMKQS